MYSLHGCPWLQLDPQPELVYSQKEPFLTTTKSDNIYESSVNKADPPINSTYRNIEFMDSNVETLLKEQIFLMKFILLFFGFMLVSNILCKN